MLFLAQHTQELFLLLNGCGVCAGSVLTSSRAWVEPIGSEQIALQSVLFVFRAISCFGSTAKEVKRLHYGNKE